MSDPCPVCSVENCTDGHWVMRAGRKVGRTLYLHRADDPDGDGVLVGMMDTPQLAALVVEAFNEAVRRDSGQRGQA